MIYGLDVRVWIPKFSSYIWPWFASINSNCFPWINFDGENNQLIYRIRKWKLMLNRCNLLLNEATMFHRATSFGSRRPLTFPITYAGHAPPKTSQPAQVLLGWATTSIITKANFIIQANIPMKTFIIKHEANFDFICKHWGIIQF